MTAIFVTATGTDIGKTFVTAGLTRTLRRRGRAVEALKPIASGFDPAMLAGSDTGILLAAAGRPVTEGEAALITPWRFRAPLSPDMAAEMEGALIDFDVLIAFCRTRLDTRRDAMLIEGVGGVMVPLDDRHTVLDWMAALGLPVLVVAGSYLGTISHTLTALAVLEQRRLDIAGVVISETTGGGVDLGATARAIARFSPGVALHRLPRDPAPGDADPLAAVADLL
jgi:dethiobiotin synthetase